MTDAPSRLLELLDLERLEAHSFMAPNPGEFSFGRVFGGQVVAQALRAGTLTIDADHAAHSLHAYFIRGGRPGVPIRYDVDAVRDGRSFTTRHVVASQDGETIFSMSCSFHKHEDSPEYQLPIASGTPEPQAPTDVAAMHPHHRRGPFRSGIDNVELGATEPDERGVYASTKRSWMRITDDVGDDPAIHQCLLAFMSDMGAAMGARVPHLMRAGHGMGGASLDHAMWFHRPGRADEWLLFDLHCVNNAGARGFTRGTMHSRDGTLIASIVQEALLRPAGSVVPG